MNQKLSDWASVAEILSGIAVVITLIFLIVGIRENTAITRAAMFDSSLQGVAEFRGHVINSPEVAALWESFRNRDTGGLSGAERTRLRQLISLAYEIQQRAYYARQYGVLGESEWSRFETQICVQYPRVIDMEDVVETLQAVLTPEFWEYVTTSCSTGE